MKLDVAIIGGGILGVSLAHHLSQRGHRSVVLDREISVGHHASGRNAGMIRHLQDDELLSDYVSRSVNSWPEELRELAFVNTSSLIKTKDGQRVCTADGLLDSGTFIYGLSNLARQSGAQFLFGSSVANLKLSRFGSWLISLTDSRVLVASKIVIAGGAWSEELARSIYGRAGASSPFSLYSLVRELTVVHGFSESLLSELGLGFVWDEERNIYMRHWSETERIVSGCESIPPAEYARVAPKIKEQLAERLSSWLTEEFRQQNLASITLGRSWHCQRTFTKDGLPLIGEDCIFPGLYWATAFGGFGMSAGYAAMGDLSEEIVSGRAIVSPRFRPARFSAVSFQDQLSTTAANFSFS